MNIHYDKKINFDFFEIDNIYVGGIVHPKIDIHATFFPVINYSFKILADNKEIDFEIHFKEASPRKLLYLTTKLNKNIKKVKIFLFINNQEYLIHDKKCTIFIRIMRKIMITIDNAFNNIENRFNSLLNPINNIFKVILKAIRVIRTHPQILFSSDIRKIYFQKANLDFQIRNSSRFYDPGIKKEYINWVRDREYKCVPFQFKYEPLISIVIPVYNTLPSLLRECIESALNQTYKRFEICIADDNSSNMDTIKMLQGYENKYENIKVIYRNENGNVSEATNSAIAISSGEFVAFLDHDDVLHRHALYEMVRALNNDKTIDMIYTDEDKFDSNNIRHSPNFKPDWSPDFLLSNNYICHFTLLKKSILDQVGPFHKEFDGAQDYDMFLRYTEKAKNIYHVAKVLYHWRILKSSLSSSKTTRPLCIENGKKALEAAFKRRKIMAEVLDGQHHGYYTIKYQYKKEPKISIIIPTRDYASILETCLESIYKLTNYENYEVIVVDNGSIQNETKILLKKYTHQYKNFKTLRINKEFNYSYLNNEAVKIAKGDYILLLNNDTEIVQKDWLSTMVGYAMQKHIGAVGIKLMYPNKTVQHCGVIYDYNGIAKHIHLNCPVNDFGVNGSLSVPRNYSAVTGACLMISKNKYLEVGGLDEKLKVAFNDVDFCMKVLSAGYYNVVLPQVMMYHHESKSRGLDNTPKKQKRFLGETEYMKKKWGEVLSYDRFYNENFSTYSCYRLEKDIGFKNV